MPIILLIFVMSIVLLIRYRIKKKLSLYRENKAQNTDQSRNVKTPLIPTENTPKVSSHQCTKEYNSQENAPIGIEKKEPHNATEKLAPIKNSKPELLLEQLIEKNEHALNTESVHT